MTTATEQQPAEVAQVSAPQNIGATAPIVLTDSEHMSGLVAKLTELRERYLHDLQTARDNVKKNFLR